MDITSSTEDEDRCEQSLLQRILHQLDTHNIKAVRFEAGDGYGVPRCRLVPARHFESRIHEGQLIPGAIFATDPKGARICGKALSENVRLGDIIAFPDLDTFAVLPWCKNMARVTVEPMVDGSRATFIPRNLAVQQLDRLAEMGLSLLSGYEHEFVLYDKETMKLVVDDHLTCGTPKLVEAENYILQLLDDLPKIGIDIVSIESESAPGMMEVTYKPSFGIKGADNAYVCKQALKEIARKNGYLVSCMTKQRSTTDQVTWHFNHSLWDLHRETPALLDDKLQLSEIGRHWIAGIITHARGITALMAPTVNCIRSFGNEPTLSVIPINATWGIRNRTTAVNLKLAGSKSTYVENRMSMGGSDAYIVLAATVAAGMDGITRKLSLPDEIMGNAHDEADVPQQTPKLPMTTKEGIHELLHDSVIREALGDDFIEWFVAAKKHEIDGQARAADSRQWEFNTFFLNI